MTATSSILALNRRRFLLSTALVGLAAAIPGAAFAEGTPTPGGTLTVNLGTEPPVLVLIAHTAGAVVNVSSIAGSRVHPFAGSAYATSKAALAALTREMAADFAPRGIRVNAISPGEIDTAILSPGTEKLIEEIPMRRLGQPEEVAKAIYFLCTDQSSYINGAEISIDGGQHV